MKNKQLISILATVIMSSASATSNDSVPHVAESDKQQTATADSRQSALLSKDEQALKANFYNWLVFYEQPLTEERQAHQLALLADDVHIKSVSGEVASKAEYQAILPAFKGRKNAHKVKNISVYQQGEKFILEADVDFQGIDAKNKQSAYTLHYTTTSEKQGNGFVFTDIRIEVVQKNAPSDFVSTYAENRGRALLNQWNTHIEALDGNAEPFKKLLAEKFALYFPSGTVDSQEKFATWLKGAPMALKQSTHRIPYFDIQSIGENRYLITIDFDWVGIKKDDTPMKMQTRHQWTVADNINDAFAKIEKMEVEIKK